LSVVDGRHRGTPAAKGGLPGHAVHRGRTKFVDALLPGGARTG